MGRDAVGEVAGLQIDRIALQDHRADGDAGVHVAGEVEVTGGTGVDAAPVGFGLAWGIPP